MLNDRDFAAEAAKHLAKLQPDVATTNDKQVFSQRVQFHDRACIDHRNAADAFDQEWFWSGADIDKSQWRGDRSPAAVRERDLKSFRSDKTRSAPHQIQTGQWFEKALEIVASTLDHGLFTFAYSLQIDRNRTSADAVLSTRLCQIGNACTGDHRFGRSATGVNTDTAQVPTLDHPHFPPCLRESAWEEPAALTGTDYNHIIVCGL